jgi:leucyl aminopeptidase
MTILFDTTSAPRHLIVLSPSTLAGWLANQSDATRRWVESVGFAAQVATWCALPGADGGLERVLVGVGDTPDLWALGQLPFALPPGDYMLAPGPVALDPTRAALGFGLGAYQFVRYRAARRAPARLALPAGADARRVAAEMRAVILARDLVNTPTEDLGPGDLGATIAALAREFGAEYREIVGDELLTQNFPAIHAVGRASHRAPRLIELEHGDPSWPRVSLIGKGVCFDTGGLDLKSAEFMRWMKKDMGGAAQMIGLTRLVLELGLPVRVQLLVPAVENAVSANAFRPGEVIRTRAGYSVEIDNTDAEGRVILCDAIAYATERKPDLIIDYATLTGAARIALGPDLPVLFCNRDALADELLAAGRAVDDPLWRLPLWRPYRSMHESTIADFANSGSSRNGGAISAALYLERFVPDAQAWMHVDVYSWNDADRPGRPRGGEAQALRAGYEFLLRRYGGVPGT